jgi:hypothetical protein
VAFAAVAASLLLPAAASTAAYPLQAWWPLDDKGQAVKDRSGKGNNGFLGSTNAADANDPTSISGVRVGRALRFSGDDFVTIPDSASLHPQKLTVSLWFRGSQSPGPFKYLFSRGGQECVSSSYAIETDFNGGLSFYVFDGVQQLHSGLANPATVWDGAWHHAAGTWDGSNARLFIDGAEVSGGATNVPATIDYTGPTGPAIIGGFRGSCDLLVTGDIDHVAIYSAALPVADIWAKQPSVFYPATPR